MIAELIKNISIEMYHVDLSKVSKFAANNYTSTYQPKKGKEWLKPILDFLMILFEVGYDKNTQKISLPFWKWTKIIKALLNIFNT